MAAKQQDRPIPRRAHLTAVASFKGSNPTDEAIEQKLGRALHEITMAFNSAFQGEDWTMENHTVNQILTDGGKIKLVVTAYARRIRTSWLEN